MIDLALHAIAEPRRREILALLADGEQPAGAIAARFDVTRPAISQHLAVLRAAGLVTDRRVGTRRLYQARPEGLRDLRDWLDSFWTGRLADLKTTAEAAQQEIDRDAHPDRRHGR
jgi:DNA-binding transcriptional ArsR family regulator